ncbi:MAG: hypothetical protein ACYC96_15870 [Fimbriimonadaceae bacterium]
MSSLCLALDSSRSDASPWIGGASTKQWPQSATLPTVTTMIDLFYTALSIGFFLVAFAYVRGCEALRGDTKDEL